MNNELDELTRHKMKNINSEIFNSEFYVYIILILCIFGLGFIAGSMAHDICCHALQNGIR